MKKPIDPSSKTPAQEQPKHEKGKPITKANASQLSLQVWLLDGTKHSWPYAHLGYHMLNGGLLTIYFSSHIVTIRGRHLEEADDGLRLQSLVFLEENGTRRRNMLGEEEIPEDQPAIDSIHIKDRKDE